MANLAFLLYSDEELSPYAVRKALIRQGGLPPEAMTAVSAGDLNPPYPNTTPESRKKTGRSQSP
jgi:outer membrane protein OmpA-like peptidoglycan-associated protein